MKRLYFFILTLCLTLYAHAHSGEVRGLVNTDQFPEVSFVWHEYQPGLLTSSDFELREQGKEVFVKVKHLDPSEQDINNHPTRYQGQDYLLSYRSRLPRGGKEAILELKVQSQSYAFVFRPAGHTFVSWCIAYWYICLLMLFMIAGGIVLVLWQERKPKTIPCLQYRDEQNQLHSYELRQAQTVIGRSAEADLILPNMTVSRKHALIRSTKGHFEIMDLGSSNGTIVAGKRVLTPTLLNNNDIINLGSALLTFYR